MQKVYLLLRNNQQTGPYSLEEIIAKNLKPQDLVWVDGSSAAWRYPSEIPALRSYAPAAPAKHIDPVITPASPVPPMDPTKTKNVFVSLPVADRSTAVPYSSPSSPREEPTIPGPEPELVQTHFNRSVHEAEEEFTDWVFTNKRREKKQKEKKRRLAGAILLAASALTAIILWSGEQEEGTGVSLEVKTETSEAVVQKQEVEPAQEPTAAENEETPTIAAPVLTAVKNGVEKKPGKQLADRKKAAPSQPSSNEVAVQETTAPSQASSEPIVAAETPPPVDERNGEAPRKKTLKEKLSGLFGKKNEERTVEKREPELTDISAQVTVQTKVPQESWMMGIQGAQCTVQNRSNAPLQSAQVVISYYTEGKTLIERKILQFSKIAAGKSKTIPIPDHRMAESVTAELVTAEGLASNH